MGPSHGITQAQPSFLSSASLELLFCPVSKLRWVLPRGLCSSQLTNLSFVCPCWVPGCQLDRALWEEQRGKELPGTTLGTLPSPIIWKMSAKEISGPYLMRCTVQNEEWERGWGRELMLVDPYSVLGFGKFSQPWTESFRIVGAALFIVGWLLVFTSIPGFCLLPPDADSLPPSIPTTGDNQNRVQTSPLV